MLPNHWLPFEKNQPFLCNELLDKRSHNLALPFPNLEHWERHFLPCVAVSTDLPKVDSVRVAAFSGGLPYTVLQHQQEFRNQEGIAFGLE
jgi:hypothetical protein